MGIETVSLKGLNGCEEFVYDYEKLAYKSGHVKDKYIKKKLIIKRPRPNQEEVYVMITSKKNMK
jgi:hypothetical protein